MKREAARYGASIVGSEIVGLVPKRALEDTADFYLQLENFDPGHQILENRLAAVLAEKRSAGVAALVEPLLAAVAEPTPTPGGGSCAAVAGAMAAGLGEMVAKLSAGKKLLAQHADALEQLREEFAGLRARLQAAIDRDAASFEALLAAMRLPKATEEEKKARQDAVERATQVATEVPLEVAKAATAVLDALARLGPISTPAMASDVNTGTHLAVAAIRGALENVRINLDSIRDAAFQKEARARAEKLESKLGEATPVSG